LFCNVCRRWGLFPSFLTYNTLYHARWYEILCHTLLPKVPNNIRSSCKSSFSSHYRNRKKSFWFYNNPLSTFFHSLLFFVYASSPHADSESLTVYLSCVLELTEYNYKNAQYFGEKGRIHRKLFSHRLLSGHTPTSLPVLQFHSIQITYRHLWERGTPTSVLDLTFIRHCPANHLTLHICNFAQDYQRVPY
jgi:hypothetical protein